MTRKQNKLRVWRSSRRTAQSPTQALNRPHPIVLRPGDVLLLQTHQHFSTGALKRFQEAWRARFGDRIPVAVLQGDWRIDILRPAKERA